MTKQADLFGDGHGYPNSAGWKEPTTSKEAAESIDAGTLRAEVVAALQGHGPMTADDCADRLGYSVLSVRPRFSELRAAGRVQPTGRRGVNLSGRGAIIWELAP